MSPVRFDFTNVNNRRKRSTLSEKEKKQWIYYWLWEQRWSRCGTIFWFHFNLFLSSHYFTFPCKMKRNCIVFGRILVHYFQCSFFCVYGRSQGLPCWNGGSYFLSKFLQNQLSFDLAFFWSGSLFTWLPFDLALF